MRTRLDRASAVLLGCVGSIVLLASCASDQSNGPPEEQVSVCHVTGSTGAIIRVPRAELATHLADGDYLTSLAVSHNAGQADDAEHFHRVLDALTAARTGRLARNELVSAACRITITVAPGLFHGSAIDSSDASTEWFPLVVDVPDITLHGALVMQLDSSGRATGPGVGKKATTFAPNEPLLSPVDGSAYPIILANGHPGGSAGNGLTIEGFVFRSGWTAGAGGSFAIFSMRVAGLTIRGNRFEAGFDVPLDLRATSAVVTQNEVGGTGLCDMCIAGPGVYQVTGNLLLAGALEGILATPVIAVEGTSQAEPYEPPAEAAVSGDISNNEVRDHLNFPVGAAIRIGAIGLGAPEVRGSSHFAIHDNLLVNNRFAMLIEASFPGPTSVGDIDVTLGGNVMEQSCQTNLLVAFTRHTTGLLLNTDNPYVVNSTFTLDLGGDMQWQDVWLSHPAGYGNTLVVDGVTQPNGQRTFYDPDNCPGLGASRQPMVAVVPAGPTSLRASGKGSLGQPLVGSRR
jgi:hypothetical protein